VGKESEKGARYSFAAVYCVIPTKQALSVLIDLSVPCVSNMSRVVDSGTASIPSDLVPVNRDELGLMKRERKRDSSVVFSCNASCWALEGYLDMVR
jgi:hypothetical protein